MITSIDSTKKLKDFEALYGSYYSKTVRQALGKVDRLSVAEEIVQESFNTVWQKWDGLEKPLHYLRLIVSNRCNDELRRRSTRRDKMQFLKDEEHIEKPYLADALSKISTRKRTALVLRYYGDRTTKEIAEAMDIPSGTAKSLLSRGIDDLRLALAA